MTRAYLLCFALLISFASASAEGPNVPKQVQDALDWTLPENQCIEPRIPGVGTGIINNDGVTQRYDVDSYQIGRFERKQKRWKSCVSKYKNKILEDFEKLKNSAQFGLTQEQANTILGNMALLQSAVTSPDGFPPAEEEE